MQANRHRPATPKRRPEPSQPKPVLASRIVVARKRGLVLEEPKADPETEAAVAAFFARMIRPA